MFVPEKVHVFARRMVDVLMIDALLCFSVGLAGHCTTGCWTTGHREQGRNELGGQVKDLQLQTVSVLGFALELLVN